MPCKCSDDVERLRYVGRASHSYLQAEEVGYGADIVCEDELPEAHYPAHVAPLLELKLSQELADLESILKG